MRAGAKRLRLTPFVLKPDLLMEDPQIVCGRGDGSPIAVSQSFGTEGDPSSSVPTLTVRF